MVRDDGRPGAGSSPGRKEQGVGPYPSAAATTTSINAITFLPAGEAEVLYSDSTSARTIVVADGGVEEIDDMDTEGLLRTVDRTAGRGPPRASAGPAARPPTTR